MANSAPWKVDCVVGARPNFVKIAPILRALNAHGRFTARLIHTGQHYDVAMNAVFFDELAIPEPGINLEIGSDTNTGQTARIMMGLENVFNQNHPDMVVVAGDVNSTLAAALTAAKLLIPLAHVEAGLRSKDRTMPEEINRVVTDQLSDVLLTTERDAAANLLREGALPEQIHFVGNVMIDTLRACLGRAQPAQVTLAENGAGKDFIAAAKASGFGFVTLHRPSNVDDPARLKGLLQTLAEMSCDLPLIFAMHPRTRAAVAANRLQEVLDAGRILVTPPLSYLRALGLMRETKLAITDSGGVQEETTALGVPCLTVRDNTERPITVSEGTNILAGTSNDALRRHFWDALSSGGKRGRIPEYWDGKAAERIAARIQDFLASHTSKR
ncbi:MAG: non-hydrolyzing UDP-N-acetylglucosamine 2-epimerase [Rhodomicrobium sp.]